VTGSYSTSAASGTQRPYTVLPSELVSQVVVTRARSLARKGRCSRFVDIITRKPLDFTNAMNDAGLRAGAVYSELPRNRWAIQRSFLIGRTARGNFGVMLQGLL